jgi:hypothetical protein
MALIARIYSSSLFFISLLGISCLSQAQSTTSATSGFTTWDDFQREWQQVNNLGRKQIALNIENDSLLLKKDDGLYTSGIHLSGGVLLLEKQTSIYYGWQIKQDLYTASNINLKPNQLSKFDHPYAGVISFGVLRQVQNADGGGLMLGLDLACVGPCAGGEWTQTHLHRWLNQPLPMAWSSELKQEWGVVASTKWQAARKQLSANVDVQASIGARFGNIYTDAQTDFLMRFGQLNALPEQNAHFVFSRLGLRWSGHNASLQGGYFNKQRLAFHPETWIPEFELGYHYRQLAWGVSASLVRRQSEIKELTPAVGNQNFAKIRFTYDW